jgi:hypothetical protein
MQASGHKLLHQFRLDDDIFFLIKGMRHDLWIGLWFGGLVRMDRNTFQITRFKSDGRRNSLKYNGVLSGFPYDTSFWVGYNAGHYFSRFSTTTNTFEHHKIEGKTESIASGTVSAIQMSPSGMLYLGTHGGGIYIYDTESLTWKNVHHEHGLKSSFINSILSDSNDNLWISTADGLNYYNSHTGTLSSLDPELIFATNEITPNGIQGVDGKLYFFANNHIAQIDPGMFQQDSSFPKVVISNFRVFDREIPLHSFTNSIHLSWRQNFFSFEYAALKSHPDHPVSYAYMLEGFDKAWNDAGGRMVATYTNVPAGTYKFKVRATNKEGKFSNHSLYTIPIHIKPAFWSTWWFYILCFFLVAGGAYALYSFRMRQIRKIHSIRSKISQDLHDDVGASLSSINIYSSVAEKAMNDNPQLARQIIGQMKQNSRQVMENMSDIIWAINGSKADNESLSGRIKNYGHELLSQKNILCHYYIDPSAEKKLVQTETRKNIVLFVKEAMNNIAKYSNATNAEVLIKNEDKDVVISISDNGQGFDPRSIQKGNGLKNMKLRIEAMGGTVDIESGPGKGTKVTGRLPIARFSDG